MRHAEDDLADAIKNLQLALGGLVADIAPVIENMAHGITTAEAFAGSIAHVVDAIPGVGKLGGVSGIVKASLNDIINPVHNVKEGFDSLTDSNKNLAQRFLGLPGMIPVIGGLFNKVGDIFGGSGEKLKKYREELEATNAEQANRQALIAGNNQETQYANQVAYLTKQYEEQAAAAKHVADVTDARRQAMVDDNKATYEGADAAQHAAEEYQRQADAQDALAAATDRATGAIKDQLGIALDHIQALKEADRAQARRPRRGR
jgi:hypothetical protein